MVVISAVGRDGLTLTSSAVECTMYGSPVAFLLVSHTVPLWTDPSSNLCAMISTSSGLHEKIDDLAV